MLRSLTERLKKETRKEHTNTEGMMNAKAMFSDDYELITYSRHLTHLYKAHLLVQEYIKRNKHILPSIDLLPADRTKDLEDDLVHLKHDTLPVNITLKDKTLFTTLPELIGLIYVVKGSELGGNVIGKQIEKQRIKWNTAPAKFYKTVEQDELMNDWKSWCEKINHISSSEQFKNSAIDSAKVAFQLFTYPEQFGDFEY